MIVAFYNSSVLVSHKANQHGSRTQKTAIGVECLTYDPSDEFRSDLIYADKERVVHDHLLSEELGVVMNRTGENRFRMRSEKYRTFTDH